MGIAICSPEVSCGVGVEKREWRRRVVLLIKLLRDILTDAVSCSILN